MRGQFFDRTMANYAKPDYATFLAQMQKDLCAQFGVPVHHVSVAGDDCPCEECQFERAGRKLQLLDIGDIRATYGLLVGMIALRSLDRDDPGPSAMLNFVAMQRPDVNRLLMPAFYWTRGDIEAWIEANR